eukprot:241841_1
MSKNKNNKRKKEEIGSQIDEKSNKKKNNNTSSSCSKSDEKGTGVATAKKSSGLDDIDALFATKKEKDIEKKQVEEKNEKRRKEQRKLFKRNQESSSSAGICINTATKKSLTYDREDIKGLKKNEWVNDGLGGVFDAEGFTGRKEEGSGKIYKAHLMNKKGFGSTPACPFDCDCCFI